MRIEIPDRKILGTLAVAMCCFLLRDGHTATVPVGVAFRISAEAGPVGGKPAIATDGTNFLVVWRDPRNLATSANDVFGARVSPNGTVLDPTGIPISTSTGDLQATAVPSVAFDGTNYLVVWVATIPGTSDNEIFAARVTPNGTVLDATELQITSGADPKPRPISLAFDGTNYLLVWRTEGDAIYGIRVSSNGARVDGPTGFVIAPGAGKFYPWVAFDGTNYMVIWHGQGANDWDIYGARVTPAGTVLDPGGFLIANPPQNQEHSSIAFDGANYMVVWYDWRPNADQINGSVYGIRVSKSGTVLDNAPFQITDRARGQASPNIVFDGTDFVVVWMVDHGLAKYRLTDVYARRVSKEGIVLDPQATPVATSYGGQFAPVLGYKASTFLVAWGESLSEGRCSSGCIYGQILQKQQSQTPVQSLGSSTRPTTRRLTTSPKAAASLTGQAWVWYREPAYSSVDIKVTTNLNAIWGLDTTTMYTVGEAPNGYDVPVLHYDGSGAWWAIFNITRGRLYGFWGSGPNDLWTVGWCSDIEHFDGQSWSATNCLDSPVGVAPIGMGLWGTSSTNILEVGVEGSSFKYEPGPGRTLRDSWVKQPTGVAVGLWDVWGTSASNAYAVGEFGTILRYNGSSWTAQSSIPTLQSLNAIWGSSATDVFAVGDFGTILHYNGNSWTVQDSGTTQHLFGVWGSGASDVFAVGFRGTILHHDGSKWQAETAAEALDLYGVRGAGSNAWAVGDQGVILRRTLAKKRVGQITSQ